MFGFKRERIHNITLYAPIKGKVVPLEDVPDPVFSQRMIGDGFAIVPSAGLVCSPCKGHLIQIFPTNHAIMIKTSQGLDIIIHLGIDTVKLKGKGFKRLVEPGCSLKVGQPLVDMDLQHIIDQKKDIISPILITSLDQIKNMEVMYKHCHIKDKICRLALHNSYNKGDG
ncbi:PTS glucose transporter subunit IIA [Vallitalea pronyensis]|uniref:PTS glucose transporter subunit IIA n=1 Tax=Vallitalea pronyensis TaxID=1348613 RepID=A0A8J8MLL2_9FIRM|nr:PTS glucose transporter subunit IIA [Vallitalea pronyensis]QUI23940.1 PTS glucose transporter subunit IIA [Vallitalea pronyensis]